MKTDRRARATARNIFVDCLANARLELNEIARQIITTSLCFRFTEFSSTVNFVPA